MSTFNADIRNCKDAGEDWITREVSTQPSCPLWPDHYVRHVQYVQHDHYIHLVQYQSYRIYWKTTILDSNMSSISKMVLW